MRIHFILIREGPSDDGLVPHLESLCLDAGADEVTGVPEDFGRLPEPVGRSVAAKLGAALKLEPQANLIFIHRDADGRDPEPRLREIEDAVNACRAATRCVAVVPVQETEAWLLLDEGAIRRVAGRPNGRHPLNLPAPHLVESVARPKEHLMQALVLAGECTGRRLQRFQADFPAQRRLLLQRLPVGGPLTSLPSWQRTRAALEEAVGMLRTITAL